MTGNPKAVWAEKVGQVVVKALRAHKFDAFYCKTKLDAKKKVIELIEDEYKKNSQATVAWGGSQSMADLGVMEEVKSRAKTGAWRTLDRDNATTTEEKLETMRRSLLADVYLSGTNAVTLDGKLFNIDGNGNRVAAMIYGPKVVIIACGINKIARDIEAAVSLVRGRSAPMNAQRFDLDTPCSVNGRCADCDSDKCICNVFSVIKHSKVPGRIKVVLVGEELGF